MENQLLEVNTLFGKTRELSCSQLKQRLLFTLPQII